jgi:glutamine amidotransferase
MKIEVLDLGINNLKSLTTGLNALSNVDLVVIDDASKTKSPDLIVLPGVGAFGEAMKRMRERSFDSLVKDHITKGNKIFGVCLGMQLLFEESDESPNCSGLGIFSGGVKRLNRNARVPNVGWLEAKYSPNPNWMTKLEKNEYYFVHSYAAVPSNAAEILAKSVHGGEEFASVVISDRAFGVQFHPEKSSGAGEELLSGLFSWTSDAKN